MLPNIPKNTINSIIRTFKTSGVVNLKPRGVRRRLKRTDNLTSQILAILSEDCTMTLREIQNLTGLKNVSVCLTTVFKTLVAKFLV
jgi:DNA-binding Lrp family transcriptional regulator